MASALNTLSSNQKTQLRNAFTLLDGDSGDSLVTKSDLIGLHKTLGLEVPSDSDLEKMLKDAGSNGEKGVNFTQFSNVLAKEFQHFNDRLTIYNAFKLFADGEGVDQNKDLMIDVEKLKDSCCSVQSGDIGSGDNRLSRTTFDNLVKGFVKEQSDGKKLLSVNQWLEAYID